MDQVTRQRRWSAGRGRAETVIALSIGAFLVVGSLGGCGAGSTSAPTSTPISALPTQPTGKAATTAPSVSRTSTAPPTVRPATTWSAAAIRILTTTTDGSDVILTVRAPASTTFAVGSTTSSPGRVCSQAVAPGGAVTYRVVCPLLETDDQLIATITSGAFSYSFLKTVQRA